jgi:signal transduction histidine kinase
VDDEVLWRSDGTSFPAEYWSYPQRRDGVVTGAVVTFLDITERKELELEMDYHEQELTQFSTSLAVANKKLNLLSSITRHDITNQLTVLVGYLLILEKKQPDTSYAEYFQKINTSAQRISAMLQFTKEYEKIGVNAPVWQDVRTLVDTAVKQVLVGKVMVKNDLPAGQEVFADPLVVKVFYNLMDNALRYGGKITTIRFSVQESGDDSLIVCEDDGDGVPANEKEKIFDRGFGKNTGLGLALALEILAITGITITEAGVPGIGARFEITVPKGKYRMRKEDGV